MKNPFAWLTRSNSDTLILCPASAAVGGVTRVALTLGANLHSRGRNVTLAFPEEFLSDPAFAAWTAGVTAPIVGLGALLPEDKVRSWKDSWQLWRALRGHREGIVNIHYGGSRILLKDVLPIWLSGRRCIVTCHAPTSPMLADHAKKLRLAARFVEHITAVSYDIVEILVDAGVSRSKISVIHGGVEPPSACQDRATARRTLGLPLSAFVVGTVARLSPEKAVDQLVAAVASMPPGEPAVHLLVKGDDGPELPVVRDAGASLGEQFHLLDMSADNPTVYAAMDVYALSSTREGYPLVLMEAAFYGIPSVSTDVGSIARLIEDGETGFVVPAGNMAALADRLQTLRNNPDLSAALGRKSREKAKRNFTGAAMAEKFDAVFARR
jgi:glycosyltransferase involved in cell wall biosynthesis